MIPLPVVITFGVLIGWPTLKLAAALLSRPKWRELKRLIAELQSEPWLGESESKLLTSLRKQAYGGGVNLIGPIIVVLGVVHLSYRTLRTGKRAPRRLELRAELSEGWAKMFGISKSSPLFEDVRFWKLAELSTELEMMSDPVAGILIIITMTLLSPLLILAYGMVVFKAPFASQLETLQMLFASQASSASHFVRSRG